MANKKYKLMLIFVGIFGCLKAQVVSNAEFRETLNKVTKSYSKENITVSYSRELIVPESSSVPVESAKGKISIGEKGMYRLEENGTLVIQHLDYKMTIDSIEKIILIDYVDKQFLVVEMEEFEKDSLLNQYTISKSEKGNEITYSMINKLDIATSIMMVVNKKTYQIVSLTYNLPPGNYVSESLDDQSIERPILIMKYDPIEVLKKKDDLFSTNFWIIENKTPLKLNTKINDYMLYDTRYSSYQ